MITINTPIKVFTFTGQSCHSLFGLSDYHVITAIFPKLLGRGAVISIIFQKIFIKIRKTRPINPRYATTLGLAGGDLGDRAPGKPSALSGTLSRALNMTVATVVAGQVKPIRITVEP